MDLDEDFQDELLELVDKYRRELGDATVVAVLSHVLSAHAIGAIKSLNSVADYAYARIAKMENEK